MGVTLHTYAHGELNWDTKLVPVSGSGGDSDLERIAKSLNQAAILGTGTDLNTLKTPGMYEVFNATNTPAGSAVDFFVTVLNAVSAGTAVVQIASRLNGAADNTHYIRTCNTSSWSAWEQLATSANISTLIGDTGWVTTTGITAASGYTVTASKYRIRNGLAMVGVSGAKNATAVTVGAAGSIANSAFAQLPALLIPSATNGIVVNNGSAAGFAATGYASQATGQLIFTTAPAGIPASGALDAYAEYYL